MHSNRCSCHIVIYKIIQIGHIRFLATVIPKTKPNCILVEYMGNTMYSQEMRHCLCSGRFED